MENLKKNLIHWFIYTAVATLVLLLVFSFSTALFIGILIGWFSGILNSLNSIITELKTLNRLTFQQLMIMKPSTVGQFNPGSQMNVKDQEDDLNDEELGIGACCSGNCGCSEKKPTGKDGKKLLLD